MTAPSKTCEIYFVRHGETDWNKQGRLQGHTDIPLNEEGTLQATGLAKKLAAVPFSAAFSSDLKRAHKTAEIILESRSLPVHLSPDLRERQAGLLEGQSTEVLDQEIRPFFLNENALVKEHYLSASWHPELETLQSVFSRVMNFLHLHIQDDLKHPILVVSHGGVLRSLLDHISFKPGQRWVVDNCGFIKVKLEMQSLELLDTHGVTIRQIRPLSKEIY